MTKRILCSYVESEDIAEQMLQACGYDTSIKMYFHNPSSIIWYDVNTRLPVARLRKNVLEVKEYD